MTERFDRHQLIPDWKQNKLSQASVIIVGMGALGNEVSRILAMSGVKNLIICDPDTIELSNLSRTLLFRESDIGELKVMAAIKALQGLNPNINIDPRPLPLVNGIGLAELRDASLVISCLDSRMARLQLAARCQLVGAPYIDGGTQPWGGEIRPYLHRDLEKACYACSLSKQERAIADVPWHCMDLREKIKLGASAPSSALVGTWMSMLAIRFLMGHKVLEHSLKVDGTTGEIRPLLQKRDPECLLHQPIGAIRKLELSVADNLGALKKKVPEAISIRLWEQIQYKKECTNCGYYAEKWELPRLEDCPNCGHILRSRSTMDLQDAPLEQSLATYGVAPREILPIMTNDGFEWVELS